MTEFKAKNASNTVVQPLYLPDVVSCDFFRTGKNVNILIASNGHSFVGDKINESLGVFN